MALRASRNRKNHPTESDHARSYDEHRQTDSQRHLLQGTEMSDCSNMMRGNGDQGRLDQSTNPSDQRTFIQSRKTRIVEPFQPIEKQHEDTIPSSSPDFLRPSVLATFALIFFALTVALETVTAISHKHNGLIEGSSAFRYLISYGVTGALTTTTAFWARVDYSILRLTPWLRLGQKATTDKEALILDYVDMWKLWVPYKSFRARDYHTTAAAIVSLLLNVLVVISTGLLLSKPVDLHNQPEVVLLQTQFVDDPARLQNVSLLPLYIMAAVNQDSLDSRDIADLQSTNLKYPIGLSDHFAYQSFTTTRSDAKIINMTVDGMSTGIDCQRASIDSISGFELIYHGDSRIFEANVSSMSVSHEDCSVLTPITSSYYPFDENDNIIEDEMESEIFHLLNQFDIDGFSGGKCHSENNNMRQLLITSLTLRYRLTEWADIGARNESDKHYVFNATKLAGVALVCTPTYEISQLDVVSTNMDIVSISSHPGALPSTLPNIKAWDIMDANFQSYSMAWAHPGSIPINGTRVRSDGFAGAVIDSECAQSCPTASSLLNETTLEEIFTNYYRRYSAAVSHIHLMEQVQIKSVGISTRSELRLIVQPISGHCMAVISALCMLIVIGMVFWPIRRLQSSIQPGTIISIASLGRRSLGLAFPRHLGCATLKQVETTLSQIQLPHQEHDSQKKVCCQGIGCQCENACIRNSKMKHYTPFVLQPLWSILLLIVLVCLLVILEVMLRRSTANQGLGPAEADSQYIHYTWTALPAITLAVLSTWLSFVDVEVRLWAPYVLMGRTEQHKSILACDYLGNLVPTILYQEFQSRNFAALAVTSSALFGSLFTVAAAPLFKISTFPQTMPVQLRVKDTFVDAVPLRDYVSPEAISSLILESNLSYQSTVFENLVLPEFSLHGLRTTNISQASNASTISIQATVPALRPGLSCSLYPHSMLNLLLHHNTTFTNTWSDIIQTDCAQSIVRDIGSQADGLPPLTYFGITSQGSCSGVLEMGGHEFVYAWGISSSMDDFPTYSTGQALGCNFTLESLDVLVSLLGPNLSLDESNPPVTIESSVRAIRGRLSNSSEDISIFRPFQMSSSLRDLGALPPANNTVMDPFFQQLVTSRYAIPLGYLEDQSSVTNVEKAIIFQQSVILAQAISRNFRANITFDNGTETPNATIFPSLSQGFHGGFDNGIYSALATDDYGFERVVQDQTATRLLQALASAAFSLTLLGIVLGAWKPVLTRPPTSIASVLALLAGGNVLEHMYREDKGDFLTLGEAMSRFDEKLSFRLGWGFGHDDGLGAPRRFGIWVVHNSLVDIDSDDTSLDDEMI